MADYDVVVIGSGFGGSVTALRLAEKGYRVAVLEAGRRFADDELPETSWRLRRFLWAPALGCYGIQRISLLRNVLVLSGAGVGGGSLVYANTLYRPPPSYYHDPQWTHITDWSAELAPWYEQAWTVRTRQRSFTADQVVVAAGALGTQRLLHAMKARGVLPHLSVRLGALTRTNSEAILGAKARRTDADYTDGVAITSSFHPDADTHIEPVRYGPGSGAMGLLQTVLVDGDRWRPARWWSTFLRDVPGNLRMLSARRWSERTVIALVMQSLDNSLTVHYGRNWYGR